MKFRTLSEYLERAEKLLENDNNVSMSYSALELRKAIELVVWTQFKDAFYEFVSTHTSMEILELRYKLQSQSIPLMYKMLKKYCPDYAECAQSRGVWTFKTSYGNATPTEVGKSCYIPGELPNSDYKYLSEILHYEKEFYPDNFVIESERLKIILDRLKFVKDNYTYRVMPIQGNNQEIIDEFKAVFGI